MEKNRIVVVAHFSDNLNWLDDVKENYIIYSKTGTIIRNHTRIYTNRGFESETYLRYIIDNYDNLYDKMMFVHDHNFSYHQNYTTTQIINNVNWDFSDYFNINRQDWYSEISVENYEFEYNIICDNWHIFENYLEKPEKLFYRPSAQFVVDKKLILQYDKEFYEKSLDWLLNQTNLDDIFSGRIFEWTWHYIFTKNPIDKNNYNFFI